MKLIRKFIVAVMSVALVAGLSFAQKEEEKVEKQPEKNPIVKIQTNHGDIYLEVFLNETPIHAQNFLSKVDEGDYDSLIFHRVVKGFVIQGGDPTGTGRGSMGPERLVDEESPFPQVRGTVAMARSAAGASNCQFYINLKDNSFLDKQKFSAFAKVVDGMDVVDKIENVEIGAGDKPVSDVVMIKLERVEKIPEKPEGE
jgi:cyclophilin family peptidyl-prolyl cis-trans isomerase